MLTNIKEQFKKLINWCFTVTVAVAKDKLVELFNNDLILGSLATILLVVTMARFFIYLYNADKELELINEAFEVGQDFKIKGSTFATPIIISVVFGILISYVTDIIIYSLGALVLSIADLYGQSVVNQNIATLLFRDNEWSEKQQSLFELYLQKPLLLRGSFYVAVTAITFILAFWANYKSIKLLTYLSYTLIILLFTIGELVIYKWRKELIYEYY